MLEEWQNLALRPMMSNKSKMHNKTIKPTQKIDEFRNASLSCDEDSWCVYAAGYKRAADILISNVKTTFEINTVIYPILALFRQYVELTLKEIIAYGQYLDEHNVRQGGHDLIQLWNTSKSYIKKHYKADKSDKLKKIESLINNLHELDPTSEATRYPYVKSKKSVVGKRESFPYDVQPINLDGLSLEIDELDRLLHEITTYMSAATDLEAEFRSEYYFQVGGYEDF